MSDQEILERVIQKALDRGWKPRSWKLEDGQELYDEEICNFDIYRYGIKKVTFFNEDAVRFFIPVWEIIFNHDFAKALWGNGHSPTVVVSRYESTDTRKSYVTELGPMYMWHLQQMAIAADPVKYLGEQL